MKGFHRADTRILDSPLSRGFGTIGNLIACSVILILRRRCGNLCRCTDTWLRPYRINRALAFQPPLASSYRGIRRRARFDNNRKTRYLEARSTETCISEAPHEDEEIQDDRLRLIFTCCHPALAPEGQVALTLREVCGLTTEDIARAFLVTPATLAQRIVRAKAIIRDKAIPYQVPSPQELPARLGAVLQVVYLVFNEGYSAEATGSELSREAIRLGRLLRELLPEPEVTGLLGLMLLQESRRAARSSPEGDLILLDQQDRSLWNQDQIAEGIARSPKTLLHRAVSVLTPAGSHCGSSSRGFLAGSY
jgi:RNA polymerase sigma-70 factor (ECF subfamily)